MREPPGMVCRLWLVLNIPINRCGGNAWLHWVVLLLGCVVLSYVPRGLKCGTTSYRVVVAGWCGHEHVVVNSIQRRLGAFALSCIVSISTDDANRRH